jgi:hypothetical protein
MSLVFSSPAFAQFLPSGTTPFIFLLIFYLLALNASILSPFSIPFLTRPSYLNPIINRLHHTVSASMNHGAALSISCSGVIICLASRNPSARMKTSQVVSDVRANTEEVIPCGMLMWTWRLGKVGRAGRREVGWARGEEAEVAGVRANEYG